MIGMVVVLLIDSQDYDGLADLAHMGPIDILFLLIWGAILGAPAYGAWRLFNR